MSRIVRLALAVALALALRSQADAQDRDILQEAKQRQVIATQRLEAEVRDALAKAARLQRTQPAFATDVLRDALRTVEEDTAASPERRDALRRQLRASLRTLELAARPADDARQVETGARRAEEDRQRAEAARFNRQLQQIDELRRAGRTSEANRLAADLAARNPDSPAATAARRTATMADRVADSRTRRAERTEGFLGAARDLEQASIPSAGDIELPRDWREKSARRGSGPKMTAREKAIMKALETVIAVDLDNVTFAQAIDYFEKLTGQTFIVDKQALAEVNVTYDSPVTLKVRKASTRTVLKKLLSEFNLAYVIKDETIQVTTQARAKEMLTTRAYYVGDLAPVVDVRFGPFLAQLAAAQAIATIIDQIVSNIEPSSWQVNGGPGSIVFEPLTMSLIVRQTAEVHFMLGGSFR